ncbi:MAG: hypothetical protein BJG00_011020 [Limnothrix sp. CACIAM 69d]|nr:MAG: hypothetical protein BJG00_011020 [Limnothrix sp. CACIAM 69d]
METGLNSTAKLPIFEPPDDRRWAIQEIDLLHELTPSDQDGLINDHFVGWVEVRNPTAARLAVIELG